MDNSFNIAINGYGRIGRCLLRAIYENKKNSFFNIVAINDPSPINTMQYLTRYDSTHGKSNLDVNLEDNIMQINGDDITIFHAKKPTDIHWKQLNIDLLFDCSGSFTDINTANKYLKSGVDKILISHPSCIDADATVIFGINEHLIKPEHKIVSAASCTTNCIIPVINAFNKHLKISSGSLTTLHSAMNDQPIIDSVNTKNLRLSRSALQSMIPVDTALARGIERIVPSLKGKLQTNSIRIPTVNVSCIDACFVVNRATDVAEVNSILTATSTALPELIGVSDEPHASIDFIHDNRSCIIDLTQTKVSNKNLVKVLCWFDNEWGFVNRMLDIAKYWFNIKQ